MPYFPRERAPAALPLTSSADGRADVGAAMAARSPSPKAPRPSHPNPLGKGVCPRSRPSIGKITLPDDPFALSDRPDPANAFEEVLCWAEPVLTKRRFFPATNKRDRGRPEAIFLALRGGFELFVCLWHPVYNPFRCPNGWCQTPPCPRPASMRISATSWKIDPNSLFLTCPVQIFFHSRPPAAASPHSPGTLPVISSHSRSCK